VADLLFCPLLFFYQKVQNFVIYLQTEQVPQPQVPNFPLRHSCQKTLVTQSKI